ncbi:MAG: DUF3472 domain-containing protein [Clostridia bacterium]|nr:DUF3472 domain-containing protein [Clostridia bacterium]
MNKHIPVLAAAWLMLCLLLVPACAEEPAVVDWNSLLSIPAANTRDEANPDNRMAHNIYSDPDLSSTCGKFDGFLIDFKADHAATGTYWALCNWHMNTDDLMQKYDTPDAYAGAYAGLQLRPDGPKAIMSFWEIPYRDEAGNEQVLEAQRVYPADGDTDRFGGEGEGTHYICDYPWEAGKWYRMYLRCLHDEEGRTFVEQWMADLSTGAWALISRFDTGLYHSYFQGGMSQFMENYDHEYAGETRTFEYRNIRVREYGATEWTAVNSAKLSVDTFWDNKKGNAVFGAAADRFYGIANGCGADVFEMGADVSGIYTVEPAECAVVLLPERVR